MILKSRLQFVEMTLNHIKKGFPFVDVVLKCCWEKKLKYNYIIAN